MQENLTQKQSFHKLKIYAKKNKNNTIDDKKIISVYKVKKGDTLLAIAANNSMSLNQLLELNGLNRNYLLKIGDNIKIYNKVNLSLNNNQNQPLNEVKREYRKIEDYKIKKGDTLSEIAVAKGMDLVEIYSLNGLNEKSIIKVDEIIKVYAEREKKTTLVNSSYSVKKGDTLYSIARNHKMALADLLKLNDIKDLNNYTLQAGASLKVQILKTIYTDFDDLPESSFIFPYRGSIVSKYGTDENNLANRGIIISGKAGDKIVASDYGIVEYSDNIRGFGKVIIIKHKNGYNTAYAYLSDIKVKAGDIELDADLEIMNPDLVICTLVKGGKIDMEMTVGNGRGYVDSKENKKLLGDSIQGLIPIDSLYSPIERVGYEVQPARVGRNENYDKLVMDVYTNGSMSPEEAMALAAKILIEEFGKPDFISSHGQTVYHYPYDEKLDNISLKSTLQIGESSIIAHDTGCMVISDFRSKDIACNGQGAPLVCFADEKWFKNSLIQNIGGISNVTVVSDKCETFGFDNGCGNIMIDYCVQKFFNQKFDKDGEIANSGNICESWLDCLMQDEYYYISPPKTTGREYFSTQYIENILKTAPDDKKDIIATLTALTAKNIAQSYERFVYEKANIDTVIVGGGGAYNKTMMKFLRNYLPKHIELKTHEDYGISNNFKEVMAFALLGYCNFYNIPNNVPTCKVETATASHFS